jgi:RimJ/RimL family protein N-acetyltransferase
VFEPAITTSRLKLHHIPAQGIIELLDSKDDTAAIAGRNLQNFFNVLVKEPGPLAWRVPQVKKNPEVNKWFVRFIVLKSSREIIGSTSFHGVPDENGMIEIGLSIEEEFRNQGYAREALAGMWIWVSAQPGVKTLRYTVSPDNLPSIAVINFFGFEYKGQQMDEIDGPENIYEMSTVEFLSKWGNDNDR